MTISTRFSLAPLRTSFPFASPPPAFSPLNTMPHPRTSLLLALLAFAFALASRSSLAQDLNPKARPQSETIAIDNATIHTVSGKVIDKGYIILRDGLIDSLGPSPLPSSTDQRRIVDGTNRHVYPALIAPYTQLGLTEIAAVRATLDMGEVGTGTPEVRAASSVNPDSTLLPVTRSNGVLIAGVFPRTDSTGQLAYFSGPGGLFPGRASVMRLEGWTWEQMAILDDAGQVINWPFPRPVNAWWMNKSVQDQQADIDRALNAIDALLAQARAYSRGPSDQPRDIRFDAMRSLFPGKASDATPAPQRPVFIQANDYDAIRQAVLLGAKYDLRIVIVGGRDAPLCADLLKRHHAAVILDGTWKFPKRDDSAFDEIFSLPARLEAAGVNWCLSSGEEAANERNLPYAAACAVGYGLDPSVALAAITLRPAQILGIADRYGSLEPGKSASVILTTGDIFDITSNVHAAYLDGRSLDMNDKHKSLAAKYREKYAAPSPTPLSPGTPISNPAATQSTPTPASSSPAAQPDNPPPTPPHR